MFKLVRNFLLNFDQPKSKVYTYSGFKFMLGTDKTPAFSLILPISSMFGDLKPLERLNEILFRSFILWTIPRLPVIDAFDIFKSSN